MTRDTEDEELSADQFSTGLVAEAYAVLKSTSFDAARYLAFVRSAREPALEIGCGDGDPLLDLRAEEIDIDGLDSSKDMLDRCASRADERGLSVVLHHQPMEQMDTGRRYRSIYLAGPTFTLLPDDDVALAALQRIRDHLEPDGAALVPLWVPGPTPAEAFGAARTFTAEDGTVLRYTALAEEYDTEGRTRRTSVRYEKDHPGTDTDAVGTTQAGDVAEREWIIHWQTPETFTDLCEQAGLSVELDALADEGEQEFSAVVRRAVAAESA